MTLNIIFLSICIPLLILSTFPAIAQEEELQEDPLSIILDHPEPGILTQYFNERSGDPEYRTVENIAVNKAKGYIIKNDYPSALIILEAVLRVNINNIEAQDIYLTVKKIQKGEQKLALAAKEKEEAEKLQPRVEQPEKSTETIKLEEPEVAIEESVQPSPNETAESGSTISAVPELSEPEKEPREEHAAETTEVATEVAEVRIPETAEPGQVEPQRPGFTPAWSAAVGLMDILLNYSQINTDYSGESMVNLSYGLSLETEVFLPLPRATIGAGFFFDAFFWDWANEPGTHFTYKVFISGALPHVIKLPLSIHLGYGKYIFRFKEDEDPNVLILSFPSPLLGAGLKGVSITPRLDLGFSLAYYLISFFTSHISAAFDASATVAYVLPSSGKLSRYVKFEILPFLLFSYGSVETNMKFKISFGVGSNDT